MLKVIFVFVSAIFATTAHSTDLSTSLRLEASSVSNVFVPSTLPSSSWASKNNSSVTLQTLSVPVGTDLSLMLVLGAGFLLFGALLRYRRGSNADNLTAARRTEINQDVQDWKSSEPHLSQTSKSANQEPDPTTCLPTLIGTRDVFPSAAGSNEIR